MSVIRVLYYHPPLILSVVDLKAWSGSVMSQFRELYQEDSES